MVAILIEGIYGCRCCSGAMPTDVYLKIGVRVDVSTGRIASGIACSEDVKLPSRHTEIEEYLCNLYGYTRKDFYKKTEEIKNSDDINWVNISWQYLRNFALVAGPCTEKEWENYFRQNEKLLRPPNQ